MMSSRCYRMFSFYTAFFLQDTRTIPFRIGMSPFFMVTFSLCRNSTSPCSGIILRLTSTF